MFNEEYHVHCSYSDDSDEPMENQIKAAIDKKVNEICFTDHVDYGIKNDWDNPLGPKYRDSDPNHEIPLYNVDYPNYFKDITYYANKYKDQIIIKKGLEFGIQTHTIDLYNTLFNKYNNELDFVLLSMHQVNDLEFWTQDFQRGKTQKEYNEQYYKEIYDVIKKYKHYSCLAHLDLLSRYDLNGVYPFANIKDRVAEILKIVIKDNKGIELNTSSYKYKLADTQPCQAILKLYYDLGGTILTVGSDAHSSKYVNDHYQDCIKVLKDIGFKQLCTFDKMVPTYHDI